MLDFGENECAILLVVKYIFNPIQVRYLNHFHTSRDLFRQLKSFPNILDPVQARQNFVGPDLDSNSLILIWYEFYTPSQ